MDKYAELRAALAAGPTPGPWGVQSSNSWRRIGTPRGDGDVLSPTLQADGHPDLSARPETLAYIAAANPAVIRALLAERDALRTALEWNAGALLAACKAGRISELDRSSTDYETYTVGVILDMAESALALALAQGEA